MGHGINYDNVEGAKQLDQVYELNIGHSIISRSITHGLAEAVQTMRARLTINESARYSTGNQCRRRWNRPD